MKIWERIKDWMKYNGHIVFFLSLLTLAVAVEILIFFMSYVGD